MEKVMEAEGKRWGMQGWRMEKDEGEGQSFGILSLVGPSLCPCPGSQRHPVCPAPDQASWPREFGLACGLGVGTQGLTLCSAGPPRALHVSPALRLQPYS